MNKYHHIEVEWMNENFNGMYKYIYIYTMKV